MISETCRAQLTSLSDAEVTHLFQVAPGLAGSWAGMAGTDGVLDKVVQMAIGSDNPELRDASRRLREARNSLAHMKPLSLAEQESLVAACAYLP